VGGREIRAMCGADMVASWPIDLITIIRYRGLCVCEGMNIRTVGSLRMHDACRRRNLRGRRLSSPRGGENVCVSTSVVRAGRGSARTAATVSELISLLRNKLDMSSALVVPEQDQAIMIAITVRLLR